MDDNTLAAQYAQTGDLMDLCRNEVWLRESIVLEDGVEAQVEAGLGMNAYLHTMNALTVDQSQQLRHQMSVQSLLFTGLRQWMETWDLGAGFEETYAIARRLIRAHLADLTPSQEAGIESPLADKVQTGSLDKLTQPQVVTLLSEMFTPADWQIMATAASQSIASRVLSAGQIQTETAA